MWQRETRCRASDPRHHRRWRHCVKSCLCARSYRPSTTSDCLRHLGYDANRPANGPTRGARLALWEVGQSGRRVRSRHSQIKSSVTDYRQSSEVGAEGISMTGGPGGQEGRTPTSLGSREMKSRWNCGSITCIICLTCVGSQLSISSSSASSFSGPVQLCSEGREIERQREGGDIKRGSLIARRLVARKREKIPANCTRWESTQLSDVRPVDWRSVQVKKKKKI